MKAQGGGVILNTSSMVSLYGQPAGVGYPASKFAVNGLMAGSTMWECIVGSAFTYCLGLLTNARVVI